MQRYVLEASDSVQWPCEYGDKLFSCIKTGIFLTIFNSLGKTVPCRSYWIQLNIKIYSPYFICLTTICFLYYSDKNSKRARDLHLLKKLKAFLKAGDYDDEKLVEEVRKTVQELKTNGVRTQAIEMLSTSKYIVPDALSIAVNIVVDKLIEQGKLVLKTECVCCYVFLFYIIMPLFAKII